MLLTPSSSGGFTTCCMSLSRTFFCSGASTSHTIKPPQCGVHIPHNKFVLNNLWSVGDPCPTSDMQCSPKKYVIILKINTGYAFERWKKTVNAIGLNSSTFLERNWFWFAETFPVKTVVLNSCHLAFGAALKETLHLTKNILVLPWRKVHFASSRYINECM